VNIVVCVKQIQDPEIAASVFRVDEDARKVIPVPGLPPVISPFDEQAVEAALRIRDAAGEDSGIEITVVTMGPEGARAVVKAALALGADKAVMLTDAAFDDGDGYATARALAATIDRIGGADLVLTGRQAADWDAGIVGVGIAELLDMPAVTLARDVQVDGETVRVERVLEDGVETVEAPLPALVTISNELGAVRHATMRETMRAAKKPIETWTPADIGLDETEVGTAAARRVLERLYIPDSDIECEFVGGETAAEMAAELARRLHDADLV
jgi:electron transfer flavoprotein beta subunit